MTANDWEEKSVCTVYINPNQASLALTIFYDSELIYSASLHLCEKNIFIIIQIMLLNEKRL